MREDGRLNLPCIQWPDDGLIESLPTDRKVAAKHFDIRDGIELELRRALPSFTRQEDAELGATRDLLDT